MNGRRRRKKKMEGKSHKWKTLCLGPEAAASGLYKNLLFFFIFIYFFFVCLIIIFVYRERRVTLFLVSPHSLPHRPLSLFLSFLCLCSGHFLYLHGRSGATIWIWIWFFFFVIKFKNWVLVEFKWRKGWDRLVKCRKIQEKCFWMLE